MLRFPYQIGKCRVLNTNSGYACDFCWRNPNLLHRNGYILGDDFLPNNRHTPLLVFVNSRSGPQQGDLLVGQLRRLLNPIQVWDLDDGSPERVLESFCALSRLRILVCGGDGTVSWIISCLEKMKIERWPPIAILPLGTGNDLARIHGWGGGYNNESLLTILEQISEAYISLLDRWEMKIESKKGQIQATKSFFNYVGVGADAQAALQVHMLRESKPNLFFSRLVNKMWYLVFGAEEVIKESNINLTKEITLIADGVEVPLPHDSQGIILLNVDSFSGGVPMWALGVKQDTGNHSATSSPGGKSFCCLREAECMDPISPRRVRSMT
jgi:diacylglycerol kinase (ATP)